MSSTPRRPSAWWFALPALLAAAAVAVVGYAVVSVAVAIAGYDIEPVPSTTEVVVQDRPVAVWSETVPVTCSATDETGASSFRSGVGSMTYTRGTRTWERVGQVVGPPGSRHQLDCTLPAAAPQVVGLADSPQVAERFREVGIALAVAGGLATAAFVLLLVLALKRRRVPPPSAGSVGQS